MPKKSNPAVSEELLNVQRILGWMDLVIGSIDDAVYVTDDQAHIVFANQAFSDFLGMPRVFLLGQRLDEVFRIEPISKVPPEFAVKRRDLAEGEASGLYNWTNAAGTSFILSVSARRLAANGNTVYLARNITQEYQLTRMKANFIDMASHQLRTPMTAVMTYAHMLRDGFAGDLTPQQEKLSDTIIVSAEHMISLVNDLLQITRIQSSKDTVTSGPVDITELFKTVQEEFAPRLKAKQLTMRITAGGRKPVIQTDRSLLHEILSSLIVNAVQYTPEGGTITVAYHTEKTKHAIPVSDTGIGIPDNMQATIFNQSSRADNALKEHPEGTGLGLYIVSLMLDKLKGTIELESQLGKGTTFTVTLPDQPVSEAAPKP